MSKTVPPFGDAPVGADCEQELKPCPFCGGTKFWLYNESWMAFFPKYVVQCCFCYRKSKPKISERRARKEWNRRVGGESAMKKVAEQPAADVVEVAKVADVIESIAWYNGHTGWLHELKQKLDAKADGEFLCSDIPLEEWNTDKHAIWMFLVGMFGNWGTSIRGGWIEKCAEAAAFLGLMDLDDDDAEDAGM